MKFINQFIKFYTLLNFIIVSEPFFIKGKLFDY